MSEGGWSGFDSDLVSSAALQDAAEGMGAVYQSAVGDAAALGQPWGENDEIARAFIAGYPVDSMTEAMKGAAGAIAGMSSGVAELAKGFEGTEVVNTGLAGELGGDDGGAARGRGVAPL
jgi:hypothetical protein